MAALGSTTLIAEVTRVSHRFRFVALVLAAPAISHAQVGRAGLPQHFEIDAAHSMMGFSVRFMGLSNVRGAFGTYAGTIMYEPSAPERSSVSVVILTKSLSTNSTSRDQHLRSPDFFDVERYPTIAFRSSVVHQADSGYVVDGDFTLHGVTKHLAIPFVMLNPPVSDAWGNQRMTFQGNLRISRKDYGILGTAFWNSEFDPGRMAVSDDVDIELLVSATVPNVDKWMDPAGDSLIKEINRQGVSATMAQLKAGRTSNPHIDSIGPFAYVVAAEKLAKAGRLTDAAGVYATAVELKPHSAMLLAREATLFARQGDRARALGVFEQLRQLDSTSTIAAEWLRVLQRK